MLSFLRNLFDRDRGRWDTAELARRLGVSDDQLRAIRPAYHRFQIPKRRGGMRTILAPEPALRQLQRRILRRVLARLKAHPACVGFERGHSIVTNAQPHAGKRVVIRLDIHDFFASTSARRVERYFRDIGWRKEPAALLTKLCTYEGGLPPGAPTSPRLANLVNYRVDARLEGLAHARHASYTRYADDLTFSSDEPMDEDGQPVRLTPIIAFTREVLAENGYRLHHGRKLRIMRTGDRQQVTGLVVNDRPQLPRPTRRWLRAVEHRLATGQPITLTPQQLAGWRALRGMIEAQRAR